MVGNTVVSSADRTGNDMKYVNFGEDEGGVHNGTMYMYNNTCIANETSNAFVWLSTASPSDPTYAVLKNNIFYGSADLVYSATPAGHVSGSNNWIPAGSLFPASDTLTDTLTGSAPGFVDPTANEFQLMMTSACIAAGTSNLTFYDGNGDLESVSAASAALLSQGLTGQDLFSGSVVDIGAYEQAPEPASLTLLALGGLGVAGRFLWPRVKANAGRAN